MSKKGPFGCKCQTLAHRVVGDGCDECNHETDVLSILREELPTALTVEDVDRIHQECAEGEFDGGEPCDDYGHGWSQGQRVLADRIKKAIIKQERG